MFEYTQQPLSATPYGCSPYNSKKMIRLSLDCLVKNQTDKFEIRWFRENVTGAVEDLGLGNPNELQDEIHWFSRYHNSDFFHQQYNPSYLGKYWCQVINTTADPDQPLMRSNVFTLLAPQDYTNQTKCSPEVQSEHNNTCADLPVHSEQTTLPAPTTTLSSYVNFDKTSCWKIPDCKTISKEKYHVSSVA